MLEEILFFKKVLCQFPINCQENVNKTTSIIYSSLVSNENKQNFIQLPVSPCCNNIF